MKQKLLPLVLFLAFSAQALTPFIGQFYNADGTPQTNYMVMTAYPPTVNGFTVYGTNTVFGFVYITNTPNASGMFSNACFPNFYKVTIPAISQQFFETIPDTNGWFIFALGMTNSPVVSAPGNGFSLVTNYLGYLPATNGGNIANSQLSTNVIYAAPNGNYSILTNYNFAWLTLSTNSVIGSSWTNLPPGSICTTTNGQFFVLSNSVWLVK